MHWLTLTLAGSLGVYPQVLRNEKFNEKCDVFSMGVVLWELITRKEPYAKMAPLQVIAAVVFQGQRLPQPTGCDPRLCDLIDRCWAPESETRPSFFAVQELLQGIFEDLVRGHAAAGAQRRTVSTQPTTPRRATPAAAVQQLTVLAVCCCLCLCSSGDWEWPISSTATAPRSPVQSSATQRHCTTRLCLGPRYA